MTQVVTATTVRNYLGVDTTAGQYSDTTMNQNIMAAQNYLEQKTGRWFIDRPTTTFTTTSNGRAQVYIPGFRTVTAVTLQGAALVTNASYWALADPLGTGVYTAIQTRAFTSYRDGGRRPWLANPEWFDRNLDSPWFPGNYGGGYANSSLPNDLVVTGDGGYLTASLPAMFLQAVTVLGAFFTQRPASILADVAITPAGGVLNYAAMPSEVNEFVRVWAIGEVAVSV